ncbi:hypothetical protein [Streptacidiphilus sp. MAP5-3]|uniref:hypothetical protein n=1 Tax=unclassified Streptacidiphilus TaxID=2643834 RepID=UPI0035124884
MATEQHSAEQQRVEQQSLEERSRVERAVMWALHNLDGLVGLGVAVVVGLLDIFSNNLSSSVTSGSILLVLASLVYASLAERKRRTVDMRRALTETRLAISDTAMVRSLSGPDVEEALRRARADTKRWWFRGGTGTYLRAVTLPECVREAQRTRRPLEVKVNIIDPSDEAACRTYAHFRRTHADPRDIGTEREWTEDRARKEACATVLAACWYRQWTNEMEIDVYLSSVAPSLRFDLSDSCLVITQDDPRRISLRVDRDRALYDYYVTELRLSCDQARRLDLKAPEQLSQEPTVSEVQQFFRAVDLPLPMSWSDAEVREIVDRALHPENPYS